jgi:phosphoglycolate phosphatase
VPRYSLVLLDLDGTLVDSAPDLCTALGLALAEIGRPPPDLTDVRRMIGEGQRVLVERALRHAGADPAGVDAFLPRFRAQYGAHLLDRTALYPGVKETLAALTGVVPMAVATNKPGPWARQITAGLGLDPHLLWVLGEDDVGARKPDPRLLTELCGRAGVETDRTLFVGDSLIDLRTAQAAGMDMALCTWGYADPATLALPAGPGPGAPRYRLDRFAALPEIVLDFEGSPGR